MKMSELILKELETVKSKHKDIEGCELVACVPAMVRINLVKTEHKNLTACFQFPANYPQDLILMELKSKVFSQKLLDGLVKVCEEENKKLIGQTQILACIHFLKKFIDENPLCVCSDEINYIKRKLLTSDDDLKLKQKSSQVVLKLKQDNYFLNVKCTVPDDYPLSQIKVEVTDTCFPGLIRVNFTAQAVEIARRCVQPPIRKNPKAPSFEPKPSLQPVVEYLITEIIRKCSVGSCPICEKKALPPDPKDIVKDPEDVQYVERVYCGHLFHHGCLDKYMKTPPFTGGKKCPSCGNRIFHEKWKATPQLAEARWAHQEAKRRELDEVVDFLQ